MKKLILTLLSVVIALSANAQLLWKISGNGTKEASYIVGTHHLAPALFADSIKGMKEAMEATKQVYGEVVTADMMKPENLTMMQNAMMLPDGQTIDKLFTAEEMVRINTALKNIIGVDMSNPVVAQQLGRFTPQALTSQLTVLLYLKNHPRFNPNNGIDSYFQKEAAAQNKTAGGLESIDFQINLLYKGKKMERQKQLLLCFADNMDAYEKSLEDLTNAYFAQDINAIDAAINEKLNNTCDATPEEQDELIYNRNADWAKKMPAIIQQTPTLFVVGAGHLAGDRSVIALLQKAGYKVEGVK